MRLALSGLSPPRDRDLLPLNDLTHDLGAAGETRAPGLVRGLPSVCTRFRFGGMRAEGRS